MKKLSIYSLLFVLTLAFVSGVHAQASASDSGSDTMNTMELKADVRNAKTITKDNFQMQKATGKEVMRASESAQGKKKVWLMNADLTAITGTTMTVAKDGKSYTVTTTRATKLRRNYGGIAIIEEFSVGNKVDVTGMWSDTAGTTIAAGTIRNRSIMKRHGVFIGEVVSKTGNTIILKSKNRENQTVTVSTTTKYLNREEKAMTLTDVLAGHTIRVKGIWDKSNNTVTQVTQLKDFSLPAKASVSAIPTDVATPSAVTNL